MGIIPLFSERNQPTVHDVFVYDQFSDRLRGQLRHILHEIDALTGGQQHNCSRYITEVHRLFTKELGVFGLTARFNDELDDLDTFLRQEMNVERIIDIFQICFNFEARSFHYNYGFKPLERIEQLIEETNQRFMQAGVGYQFEGEQFIRIDSTHVHQEVILPALSILSDKGYQGANEEYRKAHEFYRKQDYKTCLVECLKAFESMMKSICDQKNWTYDKHKDTASKLIAKLESNGLFPAYLSESLNHLTGCLSSAVPTVRNKQGGHGQGSQPVIVKEEFAAFCLQSTAANVILLSKLAK